MSLLIYNIYDNPCLIISSSSSSSSCSSSCSFFFHPSYPSQPGGPLEDQERAALILSSYKKSLEKSENKLAISRLEVVTLQVQLRSLIEGSRRLVSTNRNSSNITEDNDSNVKNIEQQLGQAKFTILSLTEQIEQLTQKKRFALVNFLILTRLLLCHQLKYVSVLDHLFLTAI